MFLIFSRLLGVPVPARMVFGVELPEGEFGKMLEGDPSMPPTTIPTWPAWANAFRNAFLAAFVWREYSALDLGNLCPPGGVYLVFGDGKVLPNQNFTRFIMVKHGREACRFIAVDAMGHEITFNVVGRGDEPRVLDTVEAVIRTGLSRRGFSEEEITITLKINEPKMYCTFV